MIRLVPGRALQQRVVKLPEHTGAAVGKGAVHQGIHCPAQPGIALVKLNGVVGLPDFLNFLNSGPENIIVILSGLLHDLDVGAVIGS